MGAEEGTHEHGVLLFRKLLRVYPLAKVDMYYKYGRWLEDALVTDAALIEFHRHEATGMLEDEYPALEDVVLPEMPAGPRLTESTRAPRAGASRRESSPLRAIRSEGPESRRPRGTRIRDSPPASGYRDYSPARRAPARRDSPPRAPGARDARAKVADRASPPRAPGHRGRSPLRTAREMPATRQSDFRATEMGVTKRAPTVTERKRPAAPSLTTAPTRREELRGGGEIKRLRSTNGHAATTERPWAAKKPGTTVAETQRTSATTARAISKVPAKRFEKPGDVISSLLTGL